MSKLDLEAGQGGGGPVPVSGPQHGWVGRGPRLRGPPAKLPAAPAGDAHQTNVFAPPHTQDPGRRVHGRAASFGRGVVQRGPGRLGPGVLPAHTAGVCSVPSAPRSCRGQGKRFAPRLFLPPLPNHAVPRHGPAAATGHRRRRLRGWLCQEQLRPTRGSERGELFDGPVLLSRAGAARRGDQRVAVLRPTGADVAGGSQPPPPPARSPRRLPCA